MATTVGPGIGRARPKLASTPTVCPAGPDLPQCAGEELPDPGRRQRRSPSGWPRWSSPGSTSPRGTARGRTSVLTVLFVALVFGVINAFIKPIVKLFSLPFIVLTLGLFTFIVNAFMLQITEWICDWLDLAFTIDEFFWDAVLAAVMITFVSWVLNLVLPDDD